MKMLTTLRAATLATLAGAAFSLPTLAQAGDYNNRYRTASEDCRAQENEAQLVGGLLGAIVGGVAGSQVAGNGARTEGSAIGVVLGGLAGAAIGDESVNCDKRRRVVYGSTGYNGQTYRRAPAPIVYGGTVTTRRVVQPRVVYTGNNGYNNHRNVSYDRRSETRAQLDDVRYRLQDLRQKERRIERKLRRDYRPRLADRYDRVNKEIRRLERKKRRLKTRLRNQRNYY